MKSLCTVRRYILAIILTICLQIGSMAQSVSLHEAESVALRYANQYSREANKSIIEPNWNNEIPTFEESNMTPYNILGQPVDENYHGIVIKNGQKVLQ